MIEKLRKKFILTSFLSVFALLTVILVVINLVNFSLVTEDANKVLDRMMQQGGAFQENFAPDGEMKGPRGPKGPDSPELGQTTRYFTVTFNEDGSIAGKRIAMNAVSEEQATQWAKSLLNKKSGWSKTYYRYRVWQDKDGKTAVTVIDQSRELLPSYRVLIASCVGEFLGLVVTLCVLIFVSKKVTEPVEQSDRKQKRFIQDASFELKNPIVAIDASRETLVARIGETEETRLISKEVGHLTKVVQGLDTLLLLEAPKSKVQRVETDLGAMLGELASPVSSQMQEQGKTLLLDLASDVKMLADPSEIERLFSICLKNGAEYAKSYLEVKLEKQDARVSLLFVNDVDGLEDGPMDSVFERFWRSPEVRQSGLDGAGLGLSVAREIVAGYGGRIRAEAKDGCFLIKIEL